MAEELPLPLVMRESHARSVMQAGHANHPNCKSASRMEWLALGDNFDETQRSFRHRVGYARPLSRSPLTNF